VWASKGRRALTQTVEPGALVQPKKTVYLTPLDDPEDRDWLEWTIDQLGIVISLDHGQFGICVMTQEGFGICFFDEVRRLC
jgi:hypothetical protein